MPTYVVMFLLAVSNILSNGFDQYFMFYNPMVADKIEVLDYYVYKVGFYINDYSYSILQTHCRKKSEANRLYNWR